MEKALQQHKQAKHSGEEKEFKTKETTKKTKKFIGLAIGIIFILGIIYVFSLAVEIAPKGIGPIGSEHTHSTFTLSINGETIDFSSPAEQMHTKEVHFENADGKTVHKHATGLTIGYFFKTIPLSFNEKCMEFKNASYCENGKKLTYILNGNEMSQKEFLEHNLKDKDIFSLTFG